MNREHSVGTAFGRREFLINAACAGGACALAGCTGPKARTIAKRTDFMWGALVHLGMTMWSDWQAPLRDDQDPRDLVWSGPCDHLRAEPAVWNAVVDSLVKNRFNTIVLDLGEALVYPSHPELAVKGSWSVSKMRDELKRLRDLGITTYPKLNFSLTHCAWMKQYRQMASTPTWYRVVEDLISDVADVFDGPEYIHIGMDEEAQGWQKKYRLAIFRQGDLWWHDLLHAVHAVEKTGARPWIFSDIAWREMDAFRKNMPRNVVQCPWNFQYDKKRPEFITSVDEMVKLGFDIVPDLCTYTHRKGEIQTCEAENFLDYCLKGKIPPKQLKGFLVCTWRPLASHRLDLHLKSYEYGKELRARWEKGGEGKTLQAGG